MRKLYCANCGASLKVIRRVLPKQERVIDCVEYHECLETPLDLDTEPAPEVFRTERLDKRKFVEKINDLSRSEAPIAGQRTKQVVKSTAPASLLDHLKKLSNPQGGSDG